MVVPRYNVSAVDTADAMTDSYDDQDFGKSTIVITSARAWLPVAESSGSLAREEYRRF
jgi:hypothetical protein